MSHPLPNYVFLEHLKALPFVRGIYLFGSRARGSHAERADIDLAIDCPGATPVDWQKVLDIIDEADTLLAIDCVRLDAEPVDSELRRAVEHERIALYQREAG